MRRACAVRPRWRTNLFVSVGTLVLLLLGFSLLAGAGRAAGRASAVLRIGSGETPQYILASGQRITLPVEVIDAADLGAAGVIVRYDPAVLDAVACAGPVSDAFDGACNARFAPGAVKFSVIAPQGADGNHRLVEIEFLSVATAGAFSDLDLQVESFTDPQGNPLAVETAGGRITIGGAPDVAGVVRVGDGSGPAYTLTSGETLPVSLTLAITGTRPLGAAAILLSYDPRVLQPTACALTSSAFSGYCNPAFDPAQGLIKFNLLAPAGITGEIEAVEITFAAANGAANGASSALVLRVIAAADAGGVPLVLQTGEPGSVLLGNGPGPTARLRVGEPATSGEFVVSAATTATVPIWAEHAQNLGAGRFALQFDPAQVRPLACAMRVPVPAAGVCALHEDAVQASIAVAPGISGTLPLFEVIFSAAPAAEVNATRSLTLAVEQLADASGLPLRVDVRSGSIRVGAATGAVAVVQAGEGGGSYDVPQYDKVEIAVRVENAPRLGAATLSLLFDPAVVEPLACAPGAGYDGAFCNAWAAAGLVRMTVLDEGDGQSDGTVARVRFRAVGDPGRTSALDLAVTTLSDRAGDPIPSELQSGRITITAPAAEPQVRFLDYVEAPAAAGVVSVTVSAAVDAVRAPAGLGAATLALVYDPNLLRPQNCLLNTGGGSGFEGGACNLAGAGDTVVFNVIAAAGMHGHATVAEVGFEVVQAGGQYTPTLRVEHAAGSDAAALRYRVEADDDGDGVSNNLEAGVTPGGDGNGDGIPDARQANVAALPNAMTGGVAALTAPPGQKLAHVHFGPIPDQPPPPDRVYFPLGLLQFDVSAPAAGAAVQVMLSVPANAWPPGFDPATYRYFKLGPTAAQPWPHWYEFGFDGVSGGVVQAAQNQIQLYLVDGGRGDSDLTANAMIHEPGALGLPLPAGPVQLESLEGAWRAGAVVLQWRTRLEMEELGYVVWRGLRIVGPFKQVSGLIPAQNIGVGADYRWTDGMVDAGGFWYRLEMLPEHRFFEAIYVPPGESYRFYLPMCLQTDAAIPDMR